MEGLKPSSSLPLSAPFLTLDYKDGPTTHYSQYGGQVKHFQIKDDKQCLLASATCYTKDFYQKHHGALKVLMVANVRTQNTREALYAWSEQLMPQVFQMKKETDSAFALFLVSKSEQEHLEFFIKPRKKREDQMRFHHLRRVNIELIQGRKFFSESPLKHVSIRRAQSSDLKALAEFIKSSSRAMPLSRILQNEALFSEIKKSKGFHLEDLALAFNSEGKIIGSLGALKPSLTSTSAFAFDDLRDSLFLSAQPFVKLSSWFYDLRPLLKNTERGFYFFTHMYFSNKDVFYALVCWWLEQTREEPRPVFLYPYYRGDLRGSPSRSLVHTPFEADLFLLHEAGNPYAELLKPSLLAPALDIDLHLLL